MRKRRRLLNLSTVLSLLLCVALAALWVRSYWRCDSIGWARNNLGDPHTNESILVEDVYAAFECGKATLRWWRYESSEWTGSVNEPGFRAESRPCRRYGSDFSAESDFGCWLHRSIAGVQLHAASVNEPDAFRSRFHVWRVGIPLWLLVAATAVAPGWRALAHIRRRRLKGSGFCRHCGYDLRATPDRCPECGEAASVVDEV
jgi:hypothetical protein